jgi:hypothetical protein
LHILGEMLTTLSDDEERHGAILNLAHLSRTLMPFLMGASLFDSDYVLSFRVANPCDASSEHSEEEDVG